MTRNWRLLGLTTLLTAALATLPARAEPANSDVPAEPRKIDAVLQQLAELKTALAGLESIRRELESFRTTTNVSVQKALQDISALNERVGRIEREIEAMRDQTTTVARK